MMQKQGGVRLRDWLRDERRTQEWLAEQIGTHQTNISAWIRGRPLPVKMALAIRRITGISIEAWAEPLASESGTDVNAMTAKAS